MSEEIDSLIRNDIDEIPSWAFNELTEREHSTVASNIERSKQDRGTKNHPTGHIDTDNSPSSYNGELRSVTNAKRRRDANAQIEVGYREYMLGDMPVEEPPAENNESIQTIWSEEEDTPERPVRYTPYKTTQRSGNGHLPDHLNVPQWQLHTLDPH